MFVYRIYLAFITNSSDKCVRTGNGLRFLRLSYSMLTYGWFLNVKIGQKYKKESKRLDNLLLKV